MRINPIVTNPIEYEQDNISQVMKALESLAIRHNIDVKELLKSAHAAGSSPLSYQIRALNLETRLKKLEGVTNNAP